MAPMLMIGNLSIGSLQKILQPERLQQLGCLNAAQLGPLLFAQTLMELKLITSSETVLKMLTSEKVRSAPCHFYTIELWTKSVTAFSGFSPFAGSLSHMTCICSSNQEFQMVLAGHLHAVVPDMALMYESGGLN